MRLRTAAMLLAMASGFLEVAVFLIDLREPAAFSARVPLQQGGARLGSTLLVNEGGWLLAFVSALAGLALALVSPVRPRAAVGSGGLCILAAAWVLEVGSGLTYPSEVVFMTGALVVSLFAFALSLVSLAHPAQALPS